MNDTADSETPEFDNASEFEPILEFDPEPSTEAEMAKFLEREGKCDACGRTATVIEIGLSWACKDSKTCQKIVNDRLLAGGMTGYDDEDDPPNRIGKKPSGKYQARKQKPNWD